MPQKVQNFINTSPQVTVLIKWTNNNDLKFNLKA